MEKEPRKETAAVTHYVRRIETRRPASSARVRLPTFSGRWRVLRAYARIVGILLLLTALAGGANIINTAWPADFFHATVGAIFAYIGFLQRDTEVVRQAVGGMGLLLLLVKGATITAPLLWGETPLHGLIEITCLVAGVFSVLAARYLRDGPPRARP